MSRFGSLFCGPAFLVVMQCNNYGLLNKLENSNSSNLSGKMYSIFAASTTVPVAAGAFGSFGSCGAGTFVNKADCACATAASTMGLGTNFMAWISDTGNDAICRIMLGNPTAGQTCTFTNGTGKGPYYNFQPGQRALIFNNLADINAGVAAMFPIGYTETGASVNPTTLALTGTNSNGRRDGNDCTGWTTGGNATIGDLTQTSAWTSTGAGAGGACSTLNTSYRVICMEF